jgi:hypothetical protein
MNTPLDPLAMWSIHPGLASTLVCLKLKVPPARIVLLSLILNPRSSASQNCSRVINTTYLLGECVRKKKTIRKERKKGKFPFQSVSDSQCLINQTCFIRNFCLIERSSILNRSLPLTTEFSFFKWEACTFSIHLTESWLLWDVYFKHPPSPTYFFHLASYVHQSVVYYPVYSGWCWLYLLVIYPSRASREIFIVLRLLPLSLWHLLLQAQWNKI